MKLSLPKKWTSFCPVASSPRTRSTNSPDGGRLSGLGDAASQAVSAAQALIASGRRIVVDLDIEKFFNRVNHDILMGLLARRVADPRILKLVRGFLTCGVLADGLVGPTDEGTPQGGPLSNLMLDVLDKELERRGHRFARYADDCNIYVCSLRAGERVMASVERFLERRLKLMWPRSTTPWTRSGRSPAATTSQ